MHSSTIQDPKPDGSSSMFRTEIHANGLNVSLGNDDIQTEPKIQRRLQKSEGIYVEGEIEGIKLTLTADTGATQSIISPRIYNNIPKLHRPVLRKSVSLSGASGLPLNSMGALILKSSWET